MREAKSAKSKPKTKGKSFLESIYGPIVKYLKETRAEIRKVNWPSRREALHLTGIVIAVTAFMAVLLGAIDYLFAWIFRLIIR
ncbi:MAG: preprotein translocase subunit SecE [Anaerolineae bacterium]